jgi:hypothetical protein
MDKLVQLRKFMEVLFEHGEKTGFGTKKDVQFLDQEALTVTDLSYEKFCINPLRGSRLDENVTAFRNILIESDVLSLGEQKEYIEGLELPYSTCCYSGGKSYHFIIALTESLPSATEYTRLVRRVLSGVPLADQSKANPSRVSRFPFHLRASGQEQTLQEVRPRVPLRVLEQWLSVKSP